MKQKQDKAKEEVLQDMLQAAVNILSSTETIK